MIDRFAEAGRRVTGPRRRILETLRAAPEPLTAREVAARAGTSVASTYRVLRLLAELAVVSDVPDTCAAPEGAEGRTRRYAFCSAGGHHHHFVCRSCHVTLEVASDGLERAIAELARREDLLVERHEVTLLGRCGRCRTSGEHQGGGQA